MEFLSFVLKECFSQNIFSKCYELSVPHGAKAHLHVTHISAQVTMNTLTFWMYYILD